jgi:eukaryotic-like serine/threonine-protein kinase
VAELDVPQHVGERFHVQRRLGQGGMGVVYEVHERESGRRLALKTMRHWDPASLYRFKNEFRALADLSHPNLVALHELRAEDGVFYFTMELVDGVDFLHAVRGAPADALAETLADPSARNSSAGVPGDPVVIRALLPSLVRGIAALHDAGKLHCDVKPSNVLVTAEGRVVILDFGLVTEVGAARSVEGISGTLEYMSPEQATGAPLSPASDWYSLGAMLYEALTGTVPFSGTAEAILFAKQVAEPVPPRSSVPDVPSDLEKLCIDLLQRDPAQRPTAKDILACLGLREHSARVARVFVGRRAELNVLREAWDASSDGLRMVAISGPSGIGKTALVDELVDSIRGQSMVLRAKCWERESMRYNAIDPLVDALTEHLRTLDSVHRKALMPRQIAALARLFPVLHRIVDVARAKSSDDPREVRRSAFGAMREVLGRAAESQPVVVIVDDAQWADADSAALLEDLATAEDAPPILLILTFRDEQRPPWIDRLPSGTDVVLSPLPPVDAVSFVRRLLPLMEEEAAEILATEAAGNPLLIDSLARDLKERGAHARSHIDDLLRRRVNRLEPEARGLVQVVAVAGQPIPMQVAVELSGADPRALGVARASGLVRSVAVRGDAFIDTAHDRVREAVHAAISTEVRVDLHRRLAASLAAVADVDPEMVLDHQLAAGEREAALSFAIRAAANASASLAFDRAVRLQRVALGVAPDDETVVQPLRIALATALANAGRSGEAGEAFLDAALHQSDDEALDLQRKGAEQLLIAGDLDRGLRAIEDVARRVGLRLPKSPARAIASLLFERMRLRLRGTRFRARAEADVPKDRIREIDVCRTLGKGLGMVETIRGAVLQTRGTRLALSAGEPRRVAMTLAYEAGFVACGGVAQRARAMALLAESTRIASECNDRRATATVSVVRAIAENILGNFVASLDHCDEADELLEGLEDIQWERDQVALIRAWDDTILGHHRRAHQVLPLLIKLARDRGDKYLETSLRIGRTIAVWLSQSTDPELVRAEMTACMATWKTGYNATHYFALLGNVEIDLHQRRGADAWARVLAGWPDLRRSMLLEVEAVRVEAILLRARAAVAAAALTGERSLLARAASDARRARRCQQPWTSGAADLVDAAIVAQRGGDAQPLLLRAAAAFDASGLTLHAAAARYRLGDTGAAVFESERIRDVEALIERLAPGFVTRRRLAQ